MPKFVAARVEEILTGGRIITTLAGRSIGIFNLDGEFFAIRNRCPHQGGPLCAGEVHGVLESTTPGEYLYSRPGELVRCPWHGWEFDIRTGQSWFDPVKTRVRRYDVALARGRELTGAYPDDNRGLRLGPYVAETYPVESDGEYVLVDVEGA